MISMCENKRLPETTWMSHSICFQTCHTHLFTIKAESYDWSLYIYSIKILSEIFVTFVLLCYLSELWMHFWFLLKLVGVFFCLFKSILKDTIPLNKFHIIKVCFICDVLLILCLLTSEFFSLFRVHYLWGWGKGWGI